MDGAPGGWSFAAACRAAPCRAVAGQPATQPQVQRFSRSPPFLHGWSGCPAIKEQSVVFILAFLEKKKKKKEKTIPNCTAAGAKRAVNSRALNLT